MADDIVTITFDNDQISDPSGNSLTVTGSVQVNYTTMSYTGSYQAIGSGTSTSGNFSNAGGLTNNNGTYTITDNRLTLTYIGETPSNASSITLYFAGLPPFFPSDTYSGTNGPLTPTCFVTGTGIRTLRGEVAVEDLVIGDVAVTATGKRRPIVWIGHRDTVCRGQHELQPIRVAAHAFGANLPSRDLMLSPGHLVLVGADDENNGGHLVPIMCLINGTSIARIAVERVTYWHIELDEHDVLLAEDLPAESYLDWGDRAFFSEGSDHALANPDFVVPGLDARCRPVAVDGLVVEAARRKLDDVFAMRLTDACAWPHAEGDTPAV